MMSPFMSLLAICKSSLKKKDFIYSFLKRGEGREKNFNQLPLKGAPTGDRACNTGMRPDWELNRQPLTLQDDA